MASSAAARRRSPALFTFVFLPLFSFLSLFVGCTREELKKLCFSQIPSDLANKTSPFCWY
jgi:hypothetical protein